MRKCAYCGEPSREPFCCDYHRRLFAQKVADAKRGGPARDYVPVKGGRPSGTYRKRRHDKQEAS